jgi:hypothetical protein
MPRTTRAEARRASRPPTKPPPMAPVIMSNAARPFTSPDAMK